MNTTLSKLTWLAVFFVAGVFIASRMASGDTIIDDSSCPTDPATCSNVPDTNNAACPLRGNPPAQTKCTFTNSTGTYITCIFDLFTCRIITPYQPQTCNGACVADPTIACSVTYNKCH